MKKVFGRRPFLGIALFVLFVFGQASWAQAFSVQKTDVYINSLDQKDSWDLLFFEGEGKIPYVDLVGSLNKIFGDNFCSVKKDAENWTIVRNDNGATVTIDQEEEKIIFSDFDLFRKMNGAATLLDIVKEFDCIKHEAASYETRGYPIDIQYETFAIKVFVQDGACYIPLQTFTDVFAAPSLGTILYNGKEVFFVQGVERLRSSDGSLTELGKKYYEIQSGPLDKKLADFNLRELALNFQLNYGLRDRHGIQKFSDWLESLGLFEPLSSTDSFESDFTLLEICWKYLGDLHSSFEFRSPYTDSKKAESSGREITPSPSNRRLRASYEEATKTRAAFFPNGIPGFQKVGDTAYVTFDAFWLSGRNYAEEPLTKEEKAAILADYPSSGIDTIGLVHYANELIQADKKIRNVVVDLSCNTGGSLDAETFASCWLLGRSELQIKQSVTGCQSSTAYSADVNFDGQFATAADTVRDRRLFCIVSDITFSCGNLLASTLSESGRATLIGSKTGGGACAIYLTSTATGAMFKTSSPWRFSSEKNGAFNDIDDGVLPDYKLTELRSFYNRSEKNGLTAFIKKLY